MRRDGIQSRPGPGGKTVYRVQIRKTGFPYQTATFDTRRDAEAWRRKVIREMETGLWRDTSLADSVTLAQAIQEYLEVRVPQHGGAQSETYRLNAWLKSHPLRDLALGRISRQSVAAWAQARAKVCKPATIIRELGLLQRVIEHARDEMGVEIPENPVRRVKRPRAQGRERRLLPREYEGILAACSPTAHHEGTHTHPPRVWWLKPLFVLTVETGARQSELLAIRWEWVNLERQTIALPASVTKNGHPRTLPLSTRALTALREAPRRPTGSVWKKTTPEALKQAWSRALRRARRSYEAQCANDGTLPDPMMYRDLHWHDLRHEAVSRHIEAGLSPIEAALISGHRDLRMLGRYTHLQADRIVPKLG